MLDGLPALRLGCATAGTCAFRAPWGKCIDVGWLSRG